MGHAFQAEESLAFLLFLGTTCPLMQDKMYFFVALYSWDLINCMTVTKVSEK